MYYITIDCGTTNSRAYVIDKSCRVYGKATMMVGVRDTATTGSREKLRTGLRSIISDAIKTSGVAAKDIGAVFSSGMITSEIGLREIPHLMAPCSVNDLADSITKIDDADIIDDIPVYFVRGIKNRMVLGEKSPTDQVGELDFMRGEETQIAGLLLRADIVLPATVVILSSHTKFITVDSNGFINGSLTTMSGQLYDAILNNTFVGKSVEKRDNKSEKPNGYFDEMVVNNAINWISRVGLVRSLMFPRFLDVLLKTEWYERSLFYDSLIAAEDMIAVKQLNMFGIDSSSHFYLIGNPERCSLYSYILHEYDNNAKITSISDILEIDELSIRGIMTIAERAGIIRE